MEKYRIPTVICIDIILPEEKKNETTTPKKENTQSNRYREYVYYKNNLY